jgi:hypothetical protein
MRVQDAAKLLVGAAVYWRNLTSLKEYAGTVASVTKNNNIQINTPGLASQTTHIYPLTVDGQVDYPFWALN